MFWQPTHGIILVFQSEITKPTQYSYGYKFMDSFELWVCVVL